MTGKIVILTGAGISAESGLGTFRDAGGLWTQYPPEDVATPEGFHRNPVLCTNSTTPDAPMPPPRSPTRHTTRWPASNGTTPARW